MNPRLLGKATMNSEKKFNSHFIIAAIILSILFLFNACAKKNYPKNDNRPNFIIILTDDQPFESYGTHPAHPITDEILSPVLDSLSETGVIFNKAFVTLSICSPSRAAILTGQYGTVNGVMGLPLWTNEENKIKVNKDNKDFVNFVKDAGYPVKSMGRVSLNSGEKTFANYLKDAEYQTGLVGKWHVFDTPKSLGFDFYHYFYGFGRWYNRQVNVQGKEEIAKGFLETWNVNQAIEFLKQRERDKPFLLFYNTQLPHLNQNLKWNVTKKTIQEYKNINVEPPKNWKDDLSDKPRYLKTSRSRRIALKDGYNIRDTLIRKTKKYYGATTEMDTTLSKLFWYMRQHGLNKNTYIIMMSDNGWFMGNHTFYSKLLPYEQSIRVPFFITGPGIKKKESDKLILNIDIMPTILQLANIPIPKNVQGRSLVPLLKNKKNVLWRKEVFYQDPIYQMGVWPNFAVRTNRYMYIETYKKNDSTQLAFRELYDLEKDPYELTNRVDSAAYKSIVKKLSYDLDSLRQEYK
jgi:arylsulfatase A-like enzyme